MPDYSFMVLAMGGNFDDIDTLGGNAGPRGHRVRARCVCVSVCTVVPHGASRCVPKENGEIRAGHVRRVYKRAKSISVL